MVSVFFREKGEDIFQLKLLDLKTKINNVAEWIGIKEDTIIIVTSLNIEEEMKFCRYIDPAKIKSATSSNLIGTIDGLAVPRESLIPEKQDIDLCFLDINIRDSTIFHELMHLKNPYKNYPKCVTNLPDGSRKIDSDKFFKRKSYWLLNEFHAESNGFFQFVNYYKDKGLEVNWEEEDLKIRKKLDPIVKNLHSDLKQQSGYQNIDPYRKLDFWNYMLTPFFYCIIGFIARYKALHDLGTSIEGIEKRWNAFVSELNSKPSLGILEENLLTIQSFLLKIDFESTNPDEISDEFESILDKSLKNYVTLLNEYYIYLQ